MKEIWWLWRSW